MSKVITFSTFFPAYHPRKGEPTYFIEKILNEVMPREFNGIVDLNSLDKSVKDIINDFYLLDGEQKKLHTIRAGNRWKVGDKCSPRVWSGKPYASKQIIIAPDIEIKKIFSFDITESGYLVNGKKQDLKKLKVIASNDGLESDDLELWFFPYTKKGTCYCQIICWNENINY